MSIPNTRKMKRRPIHPGEILREDVMLGINNAAYNRFLLPMFEFQPVVGVQAVEIRLAMIDIVVLALAEQKV